MLRAPAPDSRDTRKVERLRMEPVLGPALPEVADFLGRWHAGQGQGASAPLPGREDSLRRLRWLLVENPLAAPQHGLCVRNGSGVIRALLLSFPVEFLVSDQRLLGLCSGSFFVEPEARTQGFYLFKRYLRSPGYSFFFATTCNGKSGPLWKALGARAVSGSDTQYILPLKLDVMLPALLTPGAANGLVPGIARLFGRCANPVAQLLARKSVELATEPCRDWEKLAALFRRHRPAHSITTDRSTAYLEWRYARSSPNHAADICVFRDPRGNEGWFVLGDIVRGRQGQIRGCILLDAVWPRERMSFRDILPAIVRVVASKADAVFFQPRPGLDYAECSRWIIPRRLEAPQVFAMAPKGGAPLAVSALDLVPADGDSAF